jgi:hypothetical protein
MTDQEQQNNFNNSITQMKTPLELQNLAMQGMYPTSSPTYNPVPQAGAATIPGSSTAAVGVENQNTTGGYAGMVQGANKILGNLPNMGGGYVGAGAGPYNFPT